MGFNPDYITSYCYNAFEDEGKTLNNYIEWYREVNVFEDICDLEVNAIIDNINADFDEIIPTVDGIIYILNPIKEEENQFFEIILPIINSVKRDIPIVLIYNNDYGFLPISTNELLQKLWFTHFNLEAFMNLKAKDLYQALQCLGLAMITGDSPLNIENAWMRFPIFVQLANIFFKKAVKEHKPEFFFFAAQNVRKAAMIADIFNKEDYYVITDQAALLYSKVNLYLEASKILAKVDNKKAQNFKKLYADSIILEANKFFNKREYISAAEQYLSAAQWLAIEMNSPELGEEAFKLSINSWISACKVEMAFKVLDSLPHENAITILNEIAEKIIDEAEFLIKSKNLEAARDQLYQAISVYQKEGLFTPLEKFTYKLEDTLIRLLKNQIDDTERFAARQTVDEIENLWESYNVKKSNIDKYLEKLVQLFLEDYDFPTTTTLINKIESISTKKSLTNLSFKYEEEFKKIRKDEIEENLKRGLSVLKMYIEEEFEIIDNVNAQIITQANKLIEQSNFSEAANLIESQANFLKKMGRDEKQNEMLMKLLDFELVGKQFKRFINTYDELSDVHSKEYLIKNFNLIKEKLKEISEENPYSEVVNIFETIITFYREEMIYEKSKEISKLFIEFNKQEALKKLQKEKSISSVNEALRLIKKAHDISLAYLEGEKLNFDLIYQYVIDIYLSENMLNEANSINDKIEDKLLKGEIHKKIAKLENEKSAEEIKKIEASLKEEELRDLYSIIKNKAREANQTRQSDLNKRKGLRRAYFDRGLDFLRKDDLNSALEEYVNSLDRLINKRDYYLAGVSLAIIYIIYKKVNISRKFLEFLSSIKQKLGSLEKLFLETFPVTLIEYIKDVDELDDPTRLKDAMMFLENLPLFEEEISVLNALLGKEINHIPKATAEEGIIKKFDDIKANIIKYVSEIPNKETQIAQRKLMKLDYWKLPLEDLVNQKIEITIAEYLEMIPRLLEKNFYNFAGLSLVMASLIKLKSKDIVIVKSFLQEKVKNLTEIYSEFPKLPEIKLMSEILRAFENDIAELILLGFKSVLEKLALFDEEKEFLELMQKELEGSKEEESTAILTREELAQKRVLKIELEQIYGNLSKQMPDLLREKNDILRKREILKKRIYKDIIEKLNQDAFEKASVLYFELAISMAKRQDLKMGSLLVLLHGLCLIKAHEPVEKIQKNINQFLDSLGLNKKLIKDTYYITCILFIIDVILNEADSFLPKIEPLLDVLPLLEEELTLIEIF